MTSIKDQISTDFQQVKQQGGKRAQRIKEVLKSAFSEAISEAKEGSQEFKDLSQKSLSNVVQSVLISETTPSHPDGSEKEADVITIEAIGAVVDDNREGQGNSQTIPNTEMPKPDSLKTDCPTPEDVQSSIPQDKTDLAKALLKAVGLRTTSFLRLQYDKLPQQYERLKTQANSWDQQLDERYGEDYAALKQRYGQAAAWYQRKWSAGQSLNPNPLERKQANVVDELSDLGVTIAQKEDAMKQKIGQTLKTITVNAD